MYGQFAMKSYVYSFGFLVLETISGKKNSSHYEMDGSGGKTGACTLSQVTSLGYIIYSV